MYSQILLIAFAASPLVAAHGKVAVITGDLGGNGTALGIKGAIVPGAGPNYLTETDTTVFWSKDIATDDDIGYVEDGSGNNELDDIVSAMALSGSTLPQVSAGGSVTGTYHIVTTDGAGPVEALIDESATAKWSTATKMTVTTQPAGTNGNIAASTTTKRSVWTRALTSMGLIAKRADNVNEDYPIAISIPAGTTCTGTSNGLTGLCLVKVSNNNPAGPFGGVFYVQQSSNSTAAKVRKFRA